MYSEAKICKSNPELRNSNVNADYMYFYSSAGIFESVASHMVFVYDKPHIKQQVSADITLPASNTWCSSKLIY